VATCISLASAEKALVGRRAGISFSRSILNGIEDGWQAFACIRIDELLHTQGSHGLIIVVELCIGNAFFQHGVFSLSAQSSLFELKFRYHS
jgi:hypothetical protein